MRAGTSPKMAFTRRHAEFLEFFAGGPKRVVDYTGDIPISSRYRLKNDLQSLGLIAEVDRDLFKLTDQGRMKLETLDSTNTPLGLQSIYPPLELAPTPVHKAVLELAFAAITARKYQLGENHHAGFAILGPSMSWKTWCGRFLCAMIGVDEERSILLMTLESGKSVFLRKGYGGRIVSQREVSSLPLVVFDEFQTSDSKAKKMVLVYLQGSRHVPAEAGPMLLECTPVVLLNPRAPKEEPLTARTGLDPPTLRRTIVCDFHGAEIPAAIRDQGEEILARVKGFGSAELKKPVATEMEVKPMTSDLITKGLMPDAFTLVDINIIIKIATAMTAYLPMDIAVKTTVFDFLTIAERLGWAKPGWRTLVLANSQPEISSPRPPVPSSAPPREDLRSHVLEIIGDADGSEFDYTLRLTRIEAECRRHGVEPEAAIQIAAAISYRAGELNKSPDRLAQELPRSKTEVKTLRETVSGLLVQQQETFAENERLQADRRNLAHECQSLRNEMKDLAELRSLRERLQALNITPLAGRDALDAIAPLARVEVSEAFIEQVAAQARRFPGGAARASDLLFEALERYGGLVEAVRAKEAETHRCKELLEGTRQNMESAERQESEADIRVQALRAEEATLAVQVENRKMALGKVQSDLEKLTGVRDSVQKALAVVSNREAAVLEREKQAATKEDELQPRESAFQEKEDAVEIGVLCQTLLTGSRPSDRPAIIRATRRLADVMEGKAAVPELMQKYDVNLLSGRLSSLYGPLVKSRYVSKDVYNRTVNDLRETIDKNEAERKAEVEAKDRELARVESELHGSRNLVESLRTFLSDPSRLGPSQSNFILANYHEAFSHEVASTWYRARMSIRCQPFECGGCHDVLRPEMPPHEDFLQMARAKRRFEVPCRRCSRISMYDPLAVLAGIGGPILPSEVR